jgi:hypothetical protein
MCTCGTGKMTAEHLLQECPAYRKQRRKIWPTVIPVKDKLYGDVQDLQMTANHFRSTGINVLQCKKKKKITKVRYSSTVISI